MIRRGDIAIEFSKMAAEPPSWMKPKIALFDPPTPNTHRGTKHEVDRTTPGGDMAI